MAPNSIHLIHRSIMLFVRLFRVASELFAENYWIQVMLEQYCRANSE